VSDVVDWGVLPEPEQLLLADAQTSGGLLIAVAPERAGALVTALERRNTLAASVVGRTAAGAPGHITVR
jgi:selenide,water dikinase